MTQHIRRRSSRRPRSAGRRELDDPRIVPEVQGNLDVQRIAKKRIARIMMATAAKLVMRTYHLEAAARSTSANR